MSNKPKRLRNWDWQRVIRWSTSPAAQKRFLLGFKTAVAVGLAWYVARYIPGDAAKYPYYAPLGALASMYSTVMSSVRNGVQTLAGLLIGLALGLGVFTIGEPNVATIALAVGVGVLFGGVRALGAGRTWVATAALFVLVIGGDHAGDYAIGYMVQMLVGVGIALLVNVLVMPGLFFDPAVQGLARLKTSLADQLADISVALTEDWPPEQEDWSSRTSSLSTAAQNVRSAVQEANESRRANPRQFLYRLDVAGTYNELRTIERITFAVQDLTELLTDVVWSKSSLTEIPSPLFEPISTAISETAQLLRAWAPMEGEDQRAAAAEQLEISQQALVALRTQADELALSDERSNGVRSLSVTATIVVVLSRIIDFLSPDAVSPDAIRQSKPPDGD